MNVSNDDRANLILPSNQASNASPKNDKDIKVASVFKRIACSPLFWTVIGTIGVLTASITLIVAATLPIPGLPIIAIGILAAAAFVTLLGFSAVVIAKRKAITYEISLAYSVINNKIKPKKWSTYNKINDDLFLGRLPLKNKNDHRIMIDQEKIGAVLSMVEHFENHNLGILTEPVTPKNWKKLGIDHLQIETPDFSPLSVIDIESGVNFIEEQIQKGNKVYVHCKAGRSRSAAIVVAYLIKSGQFDNVDDAIDFLKQKRSIVSLGTAKIDSINNYLNSF